MGIEAIFEAVSAVHGQVILGTTNGFFKLNRCSKCASHLVVISRFRSYKRYLLALCNRMRSLKDVLDSCLENLGKAIESVAIEVDKAAVHS